MPLCLGRKQFNLQHLKIELGSFFFPTPTSHKHEFYGLTSNFTMLIMKTKYVCPALVSLRVNFLDNRTR